MPAVLIPDLQRKFALLRTYPAPQTWPELAAAFGRSYKALQTWQDGKAGLQEPNYMPDWAVPIFTRLIGAILPGDRTPDEVRQFVFGPAALLDEEVRSGAAVSLLEVLERDARRNTATLVRKTASIELIEVESEDRSPYPRLALNERFRIAFRRLLPSGYFLVLQQAQRGWALLQAAPSRTKPAMIWVPGVREDGEPSFMWERRDPGRSLFACLETPVPSPAWVRAASRDEIGLDKRALDALATFYLGQPSARRACHMLTVDIEATA